MLSTRSVLSFSPPSSGSRRLRGGVISRRAQSDGRDLSWDPEGLFGRTETGHIARRQMQKMMETNKEFAAKVDEVSFLFDLSFISFQARTEFQKEAIARREVRVFPE